MHEAGWIAFLLMNSAPSPSRLGLGAIGVATVTERT